MAFEQEPGGIDSLLYESQTGGILGESERCHCGQPIAQRYDLVRRCPLCTAALIVPKNLFNPVCKDHVPTKGPTFNCPACNLAISAEVVTVD